MKTILKPIRKAALMLTLALLGVVNAGWGQATPQVYFTYIYTAGGNTGATFKQKVVELYNASADTVDVTGWAVYYFATAGFTSGSKTAAFPSKKIAPRSFLLVQLSAGTNGAEIGVVPDITTSLSPAATAGKLALCRNGAPATIDTSKASISAWVLDYVPYGATTNSGNVYNWGVAPAPSTTSAIMRVYNAVTKTFSFNYANATDFVATALNATTGPFPRNSSTPPLEGNPSVTLSKKSIAFEDTKTSENSKETFTLIPSGLTSDLALSMKSGAGSAFSVDSTVIAQGTKVARTINVTFAPTAEQKYLDTLVISGGGLAKDSLIALSGTGISPSSPELEISPEKLVFDTIKGRSQKLSFSIKPSNLAVGEISLALKGNNAAFSFAETAVPSNADTVIRVTYNGSANAKDTVLISHTSFATPFKVALDGTAHEQTLTLTPTGKRISISTLQGVAAQRTFTVKGAYLDQPVTITSNNAKFTTDSTTLSAAGVNAAAKTVAIIFDGSVADSAKIAIVTKDVNNADISDTIYVTGLIASTTLKADTSLLNIGQVEMGDSLAMALKVTAQFLQGNVALAISGKDAAKFKIDSTVLVKPASGAFTNKQVKITYKPTGIQADTATLTISSTGVANVVVKLTGEGIAPRLTWSFNGGTTGSADNVIDNLTASVMSLGNSNGNVTNAIATSSASSGYKGASGGNNIGNACKIGVLDLANSAYFEFTVTPASSYKFRLSSISFGGRSSSTGAAQWTLRSSKDSYGANIATGAIPTTSTWTLCTAGGLNFENSAATTFRIYLHSGTGNATAGTINTRCDDVKLDVEAVRLSCDAPTGLTYSNVTSNAVNVSWTAPANAPGIGYELAYALKGAATFEKVAVSATEHDLSGLSSDTAYVYKLRSICAVGDTSAWSVTDTFRTLAATAPALILSRPAANATITDSVVFKFRTDNFVVGTAGKVKIEVGNITNYYTTTDSVKMLLPSKAYEAVVSLVDMSDNALTPAVTTTRHFTVDLPNVAAAVPTPAAGKYYSAQTVSVTCATEGAKVEYKLRKSGSAYATYTAPFTISASDTLDLRTSKVGMDTTVVSRVYEIVVPIEVANIAAFKATSAATSTTVYKITGDVTFVYRNGRNVYIKDATGGLLIYDNAPSVITKTYTNGDVISGGVCGSLTVYNGLHELIPVVDLAAGVAGTAVEPVALTMAALISGFEQYESQLVQLQGVTFAAGTFGTGSAGNVNISQSGSTMQCRNQYGTLTGYKTNVSKKFDVVGFAISYNADKQIAPRDTVNDIKASTVITMSQVTVDELSADLTLSNDTMFVVRMADDVVLDSFVVTFTLNTGTPNFVSGSKWNFTQGPLVVTVTQGAIVQRFTIKVQVGATKVDKELMAKVKVYPNPVATTLNIEAPLAVAKVEVISEMGAVMLQAPRQEQVNMVSLPAGNYFVRITFEGGKQVVKQVYKQ